MEHKHTWIQVDGRLIEVTRTQQRGPHVAKSWYSIVELCTDVICAAGRTIDGLEFNLREKDVYEDGGLPVHRVVRFRGYSSRILKK